MLRYQVIEAATGWVAAEFSEPSLAAQTAARLGKGWSVRGQSIPLGVYPPRSITRDVRPAVMLD